MHPSPRSLASRCWPILALAFVCSVTARAEVDFSDQQSETLTMAAWEAYGHHGYDEALTYANKCIELYAEEAAKMQASLTEFPPTEPKEATGKYWALNDVGTCLFIRGEVQMKIGEPEKAIKSFRKLIEEFGFAQCWDKKGWYWKPAQAAKQKIVELEFDSE